MANAEVLSAGEVVLAAQMKPKFVLRPHVFWPHKKPAHYLVLGVCREDARISARPGDKGLGGVNATWNPMVEGGCWVVRKSEGIEKAIEDALGEHVHVIEKIIKMPVQVPASPKVNQRKNHKTEKEEADEIIEEATAPPAPLPGHQKGELYHMQFDDVAAIVNAGVPIWLWGAPGGGKSTIGEQLAPCMGLTFYMLPCCATTTQSHLIGFRTAGTGEYVEGAAYRPYKHGGLLLIDEIDFADPGLVGVLNAMLANRAYQFPNGELIQRHKEFHVIAGANTKGKGAVQGFKRQSQDAATLSRFIMLELKYDEELELNLAKRLSKAHGEIWCNYVRAVRAHGQTFSKDTLHITPRATFNGVKLLTAGVSVETVAAGLLWCHMSDDTRTAVIAAVGEPKV